ncbi:uncharacterized protein [Ptychodera flava]|uniref:uncharacterized protein n=1 Tax=Ptychodera flava TaxID=63121 RepID=UPI003969DC87
MAHFQSNVGKDTTDDRDLCEASKERIMLSEESSDETDQGVLGGGNTSAPSTFEDRDTNCAECEAYRLGMCESVCKAGKKLYLHIEVSPGFNWDTSMMTRLNFHATSFEFKTISLSVDDDIRKWVMDNTNDKSELPVYPATLDIYKNLMDDSLYRQALSRNISTSLRGDVFVKTMYQFASDHDLSREHSVKLAQSVFNDQGEKNTTLDREYRKFLIRWVNSIRKYRMGKLRQASIDHLVAGLLDVASYETGCEIVTDTREATERIIRVCGQDIKVCCDIEVISCFFDTLFQVVTFTENGMSPGHQDMPKILPQMACQALALAPESAFGNDFYKTVYQVSVLSNFNTDRTVTFSVFLTKCHVAVTTLNDMSKCSVENPVRPSYMMWHAVEGFKLEDPAPWSVLYKAFKAILLAFKGNTDPKT